MGDGLISASAVSLRAGGRGNGGRGEGKHGQSHGPLVRDAHSDPGAVCVCVYFILPTEVSLGKFGSKRGVEPASFR